MKLCAVSDSLGHLPFKEAAKASGDLGLAALEIGDGQLERRAARRPAISLEEQGEAAGVFVCA